MLSIYSLIAIGIIVTALFVAFSGRLLAVGALAVANLALLIIGEVSPTVAACTGGDPCQFGVHGPEDVVFVGNQLQWELGLRPDLLAEAHPQGFLQLATHMFVHGGFMHFLGNMIILVAFALPFEERIGHRAFTGLFLATGFAAAFAQTATDWGEPTVMVGASGAVFGIIGAFAASYPRLVVPLPLPLGFIMIFVRMQVLVAAAVFGALQIVYISLFPPLGNVAYFAHLGGLVAGLVLAATFVRNRRREEGRKTAVVIDFDALEMFAVDEGTRRALEQMRISQSEPDVFQAWLERFWRGATCPTCTGGMSAHKHELVCTRGHRFDVRRK